MQQVKQLMSALDVEFSEDPIQRINNVLQFLHQNDMNGVELNGL